MVGSAVRERGTKGERESLTGREKVGSAERRGAVRGRGLREERESLRDKREQPPQSRTATLCTPKGCKRRCYLFSVDNIRRPQGADFQPVGLKRLDFGATSSPLTLRVFSRLPSRNSLITSQPLQRADTPFIIYIKEETLNFTTASHPFRSPKKISTFFEKPLDKLSKSGYNIDDGKRRICLNRLLINEYKSEE